MSKTKSHVKTNPKKTRHTLVVPESVVGSASAEFTTGPGLIERCIAHLGDVNQLDLIAGLGRTAGSTALVVVWVISQASTAVLGHTITRRSFQIQC